MTSSRHSQLSIIPLPSGYKQSEVGVIPDEWEISSVGDSFDVCNQLRLPLSQSVRERMSGPYPYYGPTSVQGWINEYRVEGQYALIGEDGDHFLKWRSHSMTLLVQGKFNVNNHAHLVRGTKNLTEWFYWFFASRDLTPFLTRQGAGRYKLTKAALLQIPCPMPALPEQRAIATALSDVDALLGALDRLIAKKRDLKQAAMQQLLTGQTRLPGFHGEWEVKRLGDVVDTDPENLDSDTKPDFAFNYIALEDVDHGFLRSHSEQLFANAPSRARRKLRRNDVLVSTVRPNLQSHLLFRPEGGHWVCSTGFCVVRCRQGVTHPGFVFCHLFANCVNRQIETLLTGSNYPAINSGDVRALEIPFPNFDEQTAIAVVLTEMDAELEVLEQRLAKTRALKQGMMQELLTGRTRLVGPQGATA
jgi:type I restriction enzyme S subunit